jgi:hypothetical protein
VTRAYRWLALTVAAGALALALFARAPRPVPGPVSTVRPAPAESVLIEIVNGSVQPARTVVMKGMTVALTVKNRDGVVHGLSLSGYGDRWTSEPIRARGTAALRFRADLPGEDFAWLVDGQPAGVFVVAGSHLEEGHR